MRMAWASLLVLVSLGGCGGTADRVAPGEPAARTDGGRAQYAPESTATADTEMQQPFRDGSIPQGELRGSINGVPVEGFRAFLDDGEFLKLYTGEEPDFEYGTRLLFFTDLEEVAGESRRITEESGFDSWHIHISSQDHDGLDEILMSGYRLDLRMGDESDFTVSATLRLVAEGEYPIQLEGTVPVKTSGIVSHQGVIDRSVDHEDLIAYLAQEHVRQEFAGRDVVFHKPQTWMMQRGGERADRPAEAYYIALFSVDGAAIEARKLQFAKRDEQWAVRNVLPNHAIHAAHRLNPPRRPKPPYIFEPLAAARFESTLYADHGWRRLKEPALFSCGGGQAEGARGYCRIAFGTYQDGDLDSVECDQVTYLFERVDESWRLTETLDRTRSFNPRTNEIEDAPQQPIGC